MGKYQDENVGGREPIWEQVRQKTRENNGLDEGGDLVSKGEGKDTAKLGRVWSHWQGKGCPW